MGASTSYVTGDALGQAVNQQQWDPSVKALTAFPSFLETWIRTFHGLHRWETLL